MKAYYLFLKKNYGAVWFGWLLTFFSSFGQTFLISLYVPEILNQFSLSKTGFGLIYGISTIAASLILMKVGPIIDYRPIKPFTLFTVLLLGCSSIILAVAFHPFFLVLGLLGLRLAGQGLMSHISLSVMSRQFDEDRGKALSLSSLGYSMGEMLFPVLITSLIAGFGWRNSILFSGLSASVVLLLFLQKLNLKKYDVMGTESISRKKDHSLLSAIVSKKEFWILSPSIFFFSFVVTGIFFYQLLLAKDKQWTVEWFAVSFATYAVAKFLFTLFTGTLTDRMSAKKLFPFYLLPQITALLVLTLVHGPWAAPLFFILTGISAGANSVVQSAVLVETYGSQNIGGVRSVFSTLMVISTAAPPLYGLLLDHEWSFNAILLLSAAILLLCVFNSLRILNFKKIRLQNA